jgi:hypothetical protein
MIRLLLVFLLPLSLFASKILSYNIYDRTDRVDVMITFDTPYTGKIKQSITNSSITIKLEDASIESAKLKKLSSKYIKSLSLTPMAQYTKIVALVPKGVVLKASKTSDAYGLRLRFTTNTTTSKNSTSKQNTANPLSNLPTKKGDDMSQSYFIVIFILIVGLAVVFYIRKKMPNNNSPWLFNDTKQNQAPKTAETKQPQTAVAMDGGEVSIRFQKKVDEQNSVVMLDFSEQSYLVLMGKNNVLLDKFNGDKPVTQNEFETILQDRHKELDNFLNGGNDDSSSDEYKEPLQAYKERAATLVYEN